MRVALYARVSKADESRAPGSQLTAHGIALSLLVLDEAYGSLNHPNAKKQVLYMRPKVVFMKELTMCIRTDTITVVSLVSRTSFTEYDRALRNCRSIYRSNWVLAAGSRFTTTGSGLSNFSYKVDNEVSQREVSH